MSFQRITITGSMRSSLKRLARAARATSSASSSISLIARIALRRAVEGPAARRAASRARSVAWTSSAQSSNDCFVGALDAVEPEQLGRVLRRVGDVVDRERERDDVVAVVRRDEHGVRQREELGDDAVGLVLEILHLVLRRPGRPARGTAARPSARPRRRLARLGEQHVDLAAAGSEAEPHQKIALTGAPHQRRDQRPRPGSSAPRR